MRCMFGLAGVCLLGLALVVSAGTGGDVKKPKQPGKVKGMLPAGWKALKLTPVQVQKIYGIQTDYRAKIDELEKKIDDLKRQRQAELLRVLTPQQKARLIGETPPTTDKGATKDKGGPDEKKKKKKAE